MRRKQKLCLYWGIAAMVLTGLYPPWVQVFPQGHLTKPLGYGWLFTGPEGASGAFDVDLTRLSVQWAVMALIITALVLAFGMNNKSKPTLASTEMHLLSGQDSQVSLGAYWLLSAGLTAILLGIEWLRDPGDLPSALGRGMGTFLVPLAVLSIYQGVSKTKMPWGQVFFYVALASCVLALRDLLGLKWLF